MWHGELSLEDLDHDSDSDVCPTERNGESESRASVCKRIDLRRVSGEDGVHLDTRHANDMSCRLHKGTVDIKAFIYGKGVWIFETICRLVR